MSAPSPTPAPAGAPATAEAPPAPTSPAPVTAAPAPASPAPVTAAPAGTTTTVVDQPPRKRHRLERIIGPKYYADLEKQDPDGKKRRRILGGGLIGTLLALLIPALLFMGAWTLLTYLGPMLSCKMHGYSSHCMFNEWDRTGRSYADWAQDLMPHRLADEMRENGLWHGQ